MKKIALISALALGGLFCKTADAQIGISLGLRLGSHHPVAEIAVAAPVYETPVADDYVNSDDYYYLPDVDAYYSVAEQSYYYNNGVNWISAAYLPGNYRNYDWHTARRYEVHAHRPYLNADLYRSKFRGNTGNWSRYNNNNNGNYINHDVNRGSYSERNNNRGWGGQSRSGEHFNDRGQEHNQNHPMQPNRGEGNHFQPSQQNRGRVHERGNNNSEQHFSDNREQGGHGRFNRS